MVFVNLLDYVCVAVRDWALISKRSVVLISSSALAMPKRMSLSLSNEIRRRAPNPEPAQLAPTAQLQRRVFRCVRGRWVKRWNLLVGLDDRWFMVRDIYMVCMTHIRC